MTETEMLTVVCDRAISAKTRNGRWSLNAGSNLVPTEVAVLAYRQGLIRRPMTVPVITN